MARTIHVDRFRITSFTFKEQLEYMKNIDNINVTRENIIKIANDFMNKTNHKLSRHRLVLQPVNELPNQITSIFEALSYTSDYICDMYSEKIKADKIRKKIPVWENGKLVR